MRFNDFFNARRWIGFFTSKVGLIILFFVGVGILLALTYFNTTKTQANQQQQTDSGQVSKMTGAQGELPASATVERPVADARTLIATTPTPAPVPDAVLPVPTPSARKAVERRRPPLTLYTSNGRSVNAVPKVEEDGTFKGDKDVPYAPYGRLLECRLVNTVESINTRTPIIAVVTKPLWWNRRVVIPAGTEIHGFGSPDALRDRIAGEGQWKLIIANDPSMSNGAELSVSGLALDMERSEISEGEDGQVRIKYGMTDGSAGLKGRVLKSDNWAEIKVFAATLISGAASGFTKTQSTILGQVPVGGDLGNAGLGAANAALDRYAKQIMDSIERDGFFVQVPAGKTFYLYVTEPIDMRGAKLMAAPSHEKEKQRAVADNAPIDPQELQRQLLQQLVDRKKEQAAAQAAARELENKQRDQTTGQNVEELLQRLQAIQRQQGGGSQ